MCLGGSRTRDGTVKDIRLTGGVLARRFAGNQLVHPAMSHNGVWRTVGIIHPGDESFPALGRERASSTRRWQATRMVQLQKPLCGPLR